MGYITDDEATEVAKRIFPAAEFEDFVHQKTPRWHASTAYCDC